MLQCTGGETCRGKGESLNSEEGGDGGGETGVAMEFSLGGRLVTDRPEHAPQARKDGEQPAAGLFVAPAVNQALEVFDFPFFQGEDVDLLGNVHEV